MNSTPSIDGAHGLPDSIVLALRQLIRRARQLIVIRGVCAFCAVGIGVFLAIMLIDARFTLLARWPRWFMTLLAYSAWAGSLLWFLIRPLARSFTLAGIARLIEGHHPEFQERISSVVELLSSKDGPSIRGSDVLIGALTGEAVRDAMILKPRNEISFRGAIPFAVAAGIVLTVLATLWLAKPRQTWFLLARATAPFLNLPNMQAADLLVEPGDTLIASGSRLRISIQTAHPAVTSARLRQVDHQGRETVTDMVAMPATTNPPGRSFAVTLPTVLTGFRYRLQAGDAVTRYFAVRVAIPPVIEHLDVRCRYPNYSRLGVTQERDGSGTLRALAGSEITVSAQVNKPALSAVMRITTSSSTNAIKGTHRTTNEGTFYDFALTLPRNLNGSWTLILTDEIGLRNTPFEYAIQAIPDNPPIATVANLLQREVRLNRETRLPVTYSAEDDLGLSGMAMIFTIPGGSNEVIRNLPLPVQTGQNIKAIHGDTQIAMDDPLFAGAPRVAFRIRATDNLPGTSQGPQSGNSATFTLVLDDRAPSWLEQVLTSQENRAQQGLKQVQQKLASARDQAQALDLPLAQQPALSSETARRIDALQDSLAAADNSLRDISADLDKGFFTALATQLTVLADNHVSKAENLSGQLRLVDSPAERTTINSNVTAEIDTSLQAVERAIQDYTAARAAVRRTVELDRLADKQKALARTRQDLDEAMPPPASNTVALAQARTASNAWAQAQGQVSDRLAALARDTPGTPEYVATLTSNLAVQAADRAEELAARQNELAALTGQQMDTVQKRDRQWRELAARQERLAALARQDPSSAAFHAPLQQAARDLAARNTAEAIRAQAGTADAMRRQADRLLASPAPAPSEDNALETPSEVQQKFIDALTSARRSAERAAQSAALASKHARAKEAEQWSQIAEQAAKDAKRAATEGRRAVEQAGHKEQPEPVRREAALQASRAAEAVWQLADDARAAALQATIIPAGSNSPPDRAVHAESQARDAARAARQLALKAGMTAERAREDARQAERQIDQALMNGAPAPQVQDARDKAAEAATRAEDAREAATKAGDEARQADEEVRTARQVTDKALTDGSTQPSTSPTTTPPPAPSISAQAKEAAQMAQQAAQMARQAAQEAGEAARQTAKQAAQLGDPSTQQAARQIEQAAQQSQQYAEQAAQAAQQSFQSAEQADRQAKQAASSPTPQAREKAGREAERAALATIEKARAAAHAAVRANTSAHWAQDRQAALTLTGLATQQESLHLEATGLLATEEQAESALTADASLEALQERQARLGREIDHLTHDANIVRAQADQLPGRTQAAPPAGQATREMAQASQAATLATGQMRQFTPQVEAPGSPSAQTRQAQQITAENLTKAARSLNLAAQAMIVPAPSPTPPPVPLSPESLTARESLARAYGDALRAAENRQADDAAQSAAQLAKAADQTAAEAQSLGANARPPTLQAAASTGGDPREDTRTSEDVPSFARRLGMKLQDWLQLHGELKEDVLQAADSEGPEEYRPLIKRYFRDVSEHGGEEK